MKLYKTTGTTNDDRTLVSWQSSQTDASKARTALKQQGCAKPISQEMDVPVTKDALLAWLNENVKM